MLAITETSVMTSFAISNQHYTNFIDSHTRMQLLLFFVVLCSFSLKMCVLAWWCSIFVVVLWNICSYTRTNAIGHAWKTDVQLKGDALLDMKEHETGSLLRQIKTCSRSELLLFTSLIAFKGASTSWFISSCTFLPFTLTFFEFVCVCPLLSSILRSSPSGLIWIILSLGDFFFSKRKAIINVFCWFLLRLRRRKD